MFARARRHAVLICFGRHCSFWSQLRLWSCGGVAALYDAPKTATASCNEWVPIGIAIERGSFTKSVGISKSFQRTRNERGYEEIQCRQGDNRNNTPSVTPARQRDSCAIFMLVAEDCMLFQVREGKRPLLIESRLAKASRYAAIFETEGAK